MSRGLQVLVRVLWPLTWPIRWYWAHSERQLGKQLVVDRLLKRLLPAPPAGFETTLPGGGRLFLHHRADIGLVVLLSGSFEQLEVECACTLARAGTAAIDVGANVGLFTVPLALAVGEAGRVLAIEPSPENLEQLAHNLRLNELENVVVHDIALAAEPGEVLLRLGVDPAFHSTTAVVKSRAGEDGVVVRADTLDSVWSNAGEPEVSFLKIDTEGGELEILEGGTQLLEAWRPPILVEAKERDRVRELDDFLGGRGYSRSHPSGFAHGNYLYRAT
jgi:FkbM family methyltransferase